MFSNDVIWFTVVVNDHVGTFLVDWIKLFVDMGLMGVVVFDEWGGVGMDVVSYVIVMEEIFVVCVFVGVIMSVNNLLVCDFLVYYGTDVQKEKWFKFLVWGEMLGCFGFSEFGMGLDVAN